MFHRNDNLPHLSLRQFILNDNSPLDPLQTAEAMKRGFFASVFYHTVNAFKMIGVKSIVLVMTFLSLIELAHDYFYSVREKNRNASFWFKHAMGTILFAAEALAITFFVVGTIVSALIAPGIFTALTGTKFLVSFSKMLYHGAKIFHTAWLKDSDETYTQQYLHHKNLFKEHFKNTFISAMLFAGVFVGFLAPEIPAIVVPTAIALTFKWGACMTLGFAALTTLGKKLYNWGKAKLGLSATNHTVYEPLISDENRISDKLRLNANIKNQYLENKNLDHLIPSHIDDLLIKLELLHDKNRSDNKLDYTYLLKLINEERLRAPINSDKWKALLQIEKLIRGENLHLQHDQKTYDNTVYGLAKYLADNGWLKSILYSPFETVGGMQKIFVLADHFCKLNPEVLYQNSFELDEKQFYQDKTECFKELVKELKNENQLLRQKFSKIKFECEYKANTPTVNKKPFFTRSKSMPVITEFPSLIKPQQ